MQEAHALMIEILLLLSAHLANEYATLAGVKVVSLDESARRITLRPRPEDRRETCRTRGHGTPRNDLTPGGPAGLHVDEEANASDFRALDNFLEVTKVFHGTEDPKPGKLVLHFKSTDLKDEIDAAINCSDQYVTHAQRIWISLI